VWPQATVKADDGRVAYCAMLDSMPSVESCSSSSSDSSGSESILTLPPPITDLHIFTKLQRCRRQKRLNWRCLLRLRLMWLPPKVSLHDFCKFRTLLSIVVILILDVQVFIMMAMLKQTFVRWLWGGRRLSWQTMVMNRSCNASNV
jgi:hypothetical protein